MSERFKNSRDRLERARLHRKAFETEWTSLFQGERTIAAARDDKYPGWWTVSLGLHPETITRIKRNQLSLELGEFAYQLRAALDGLMWDAITYTQGSEPSPDAKSVTRLDFPILNGKVRNFDNCGFHDFPFPPRLREWMRSIQPDSADKPLHDPDRGLRNTLEDIHNLARYDRHRRLRVVGMVAIINEIQLLRTEPPGGKVTNHEWLACDPLSGENDVIRLKIVGVAGLLPYKIYLKPNFTFTVTAEDVELYDGADLGVQLDRFIAAVGLVIDRFDEEFAGHI